ncbi:MAG TPA: hypothetical protein VGR52_07065 [Stellaceae bacterium]|nr:hypothetical protein [Stellaceae bacterium]
MIDKKERVASYRRATWFASQSASTTLAACIKNAATKLLNINDRTVARDNGQQMKLASLQPDKHGGYYLHITAETPGEAASVVPKRSQVSDEVRVGITKAPANTEFMDGDAFVYVRGNDLCMCSTGMQDATVRYFLQALFRKAKMREELTQFDLMKVADIPAIKLLQSQGVKEIEVRSTLFAASASFNRRKSHAQGVVGAAAKQLKALFGSEHDVTDDAITVALALKMDRRRTKGLKLGEKRIDTLGTDLIKNQEASDDYVIITKTGQRITPDEISIRSKVLIDAVGKSVDRDKAWKELNAFYKTFEESGALEQ